jgi:hypothetical protein
MGQGKPYPITAFHVFSGIGAIKYAMTVSNDKKIGCDT